MLISQNDAINWVVDYYCVTIGIKIFWSHTCSVTYFCWQTSFYGYNFLLQFSFQYLLITHVYGHENGIYCEYCLEALHLPFLWWKKTYCIRCNDWTNQVTHIWCTSTIFFNVWRWMLLYCICWKLLLRLRVINCGGQSNDFCIFWIWGLPPICCHCIVVDLQRFCNLLSKLVSYPSCHRQV